MFQCIEAVLEPRIMLRIDLITFIMEFITNNNKYVFRVSNINYKCNIYIIYSINVTIVT